MSLRPAEEILKYYPLPFTLRRDQEEAINELVLWDKGKLFADVGTGKTVMATLIAFYKALAGEIDQIIIFCPPILLLQWYRWLELFNKVNSLIYRGTPDRRKKLSLGHDVLLSTLGLFKNDFTRFLSYFSDRKVLVIIDEAVTVKNPETGNFKAIRDFTMLRDKHLLLLTGTPMNNPLHAYGYIKLCTPEVYSSFTQFKAIHVERDQRGGLMVDQYGRPLGYNRLDLLTDNLMLGCVRIRADEVLDLPEITYDPVTYELTKPHKRLYDTLAEELLVELDDGEVLDATTQQKFYMQMQRIILNPALYGGERIKPEAFKLIDAMLDESPGEKLFIYANFIKSNEAIFDYVEKLGGYNPVLIYGPAGARKNMESMDRFLNDPSCMVAVCNPVSAGQGINAQGACRQILFLELPKTSNDFLQVVGRVHRDGQTKKVLIKIAIASGTIQVKIKRNVVEKEDTIQQVYETKETLRKALRGG